MDYVASFLLQFATKEVFTVLGVLFALWLGWKTSRKLAGAAVSLVKNNNSGYSQDARTLRTIHRAQRVGHVHSCRNHRHLPWNRIGHCWNRRLLQSPPTKILLDWPVGFWRV